MHRIFHRQRPRLNALLWGAAHILDMGGTLAHDRGRFGMGRRGDVLALQHDWAGATRMGWRMYGQAQE